MIMPRHYIGERTVHDVGNFKEFCVLRIAETRHRIIWTVEKRKAQNAHCDQLQKHVEECRRALSIHTIHSLRKRYSNILYVGKSLN